MLAVREVTEIVNQLNTYAPILREINNEDEHKQALILMEELIDDYDTNLVLIEALSNAISRYEETAVSFESFNLKQETLDPALSVLRVLMDQHDLKTADFEEEIGKKSMVSQVLNGKKRLSRDHIQRLSKRFGISPALFFG